MSYTCYTKYECGGLVDIQPTLTIRFDEMHAITRNRVKRFLTNNLCTTSWASKASAVITALHGHHNVVRDYFAAEMMQAAKRTDTFDILQAKLLLIDHELKVYENAGRWYSGQGYVRYVGEDKYDSPARKIKVGQAKALVAEYMLPIARGMRNDETLIPVLTALENHRPYTFEGSPRR